MTDKEIVLKFCRDKQLSEYLLFKKAAEHFQYSHQKMMKAFKNYLWEDYVPEFVKQYIVMEVNADAETTGDV